MRKSFTRFFGLLLILLISLSSYSATTYKPVTGGGGTTTNLKLTQELSVTFDGAVTASGTKYVRLYDDKGTVAVGDDVPLFVQPATDHEVIVAGTKVTFDFNHYLAEGKSYYIAYDAGAFTVGGVAQPAVGQATWTFAIGDWTAPKLATASPLTPKDGATNVDATVNFVVKFNENVNLDPSFTGNGVGFYLMKDNGTGYGDIVEVIAAGNITGGGTTTLTINPVVNLAEKTNYYILIDKGAVVDASGNPNQFAGFVDEGKLFADKTWGVSTKDMTAPVVTLKSVSTTTTSITVSVTSDDAGFVWVDYVADGGAIPASITTTGKKLTFTAAGTQEVTFTSVTGTPTEGATLNRDVWVSSQTNINVAGVTEIPVNAAAVDAAAVKKLDVKLVDGVNPTEAVAGVYDPTNGSTGVAKNKKLAIVFSEAVKVGTGNVVIKKTSDNSTWKTYSITDVAAIKDVVAGDKKKVEITLPDAMASLVQYYVLVDAGAITDLTGNPYAGVASAVPQKWIFTVVDYEAPTFTVAPANGAAVNAVAPSAVTAITLTFNEAIRHSSGNVLVNGASVNANGLQEAFMLYENGTLQSTYTYTFTAPNVITVVPNAGALQRQKTYRLIFYAYWIEDMLGNTIASPIDITFTTKDQIAPVISAWGPATVDKTSNLTITLSEAVRMADDSEITDSNVASLITLRKWNAGAFATVGSTDYTVSIDAAKKVITVDPVADLVSAGQYRLTLASNIEDLTGNALANTTLLGAGFGAATSGTDREKDYTVKDYVPPTITLTPANGASVVAGGNVVVTASEAVTLLTGAAVDQTIITLREGGIDGTDIVCGAPAVAGNVYTFTPATALVAGKTYYFAVDVTLKDAGGNPNAKVTSTFTTKGNTAPNLIAGTTYAPAAASTKNAKNSVITVTFTEPVLLVAAQNTAATVFVDGGADLNTTAATLSADGKVLTIPHADFTATASGLPDNNNVVVTIPAGMLTAGDGVTGMTANITWSFGSHDLTAPVPVYTPALAGTPAGVAINVTPKITFNETIKFLSTAYVEIRDVATDYLVQTITTTGLSLKSVGAGLTNNELNIKLLGNLTYGKSYYIFIPPNVITDSSDNTFAGVVSKPTDGVNLAWDFAVVANPGPLTIDATKSAPAKYTDNVALDANLVVEFTNSLNAGSVDPTLNWVLYELTGFTSTTGAVAGFAGVADQYSALDPSMTVSGNKITVDPTFNLKADKWYILRFSNGFIDDIYTTPLSASSFGNGGGATNMDYVGVAANDIVFHTGTAQGPIATIQPAHKSTDIAKNSNIVVTFDEPFFKVGGTAAVTVADLEAAPSAYITVSSSSTGAITYNATISGNSITIDPVADFNVTDNERVTVTVLAGMFYDSKNNSYDAVMGSGAIGSPADDQVFYFDPIDQTGPISAVSGLASAKGTELTYKVTSNEKGFVYSLAQLTTATAPTAAEIKASGTVTQITTAGAATPATAIKVEGLAPGTSYTVYVVGIDAENVPNTGVVASAAVTTPDDVSPVFVKALPASPVASLTPTISFEYNENIVAAASGLAVVRVKSTQDIVAVWNIAALVGTSDVGTTSAKKVTLNLADASAGSVAAFTSEEVYEVRLDPGSVQDAATNKNLVPVVHEFTIKDLVVPTITATSPAISAVGAAPTHTGQNISVTFSENMISTASVIRIYEDRGAGFAGSIIPNNEIETIDPNTVTWDAANKKATFSVSHFLLKAVTEYYVVVADASFKDDGGLNASWAAYLGANAFQFKTPDQTTLAATHTFAPAPLVANTNVSPTAVITITFGEDVVWTKHPFKQYIVPANVDSILSIYDANGVELTSAKVTFNAIDNGATSGMDQFTITPVTKLTDNSTYTVKFNDIEDINGNDVLDHVAAGTQFTFTTGDGTAPKITFNPANKTTETSENGPFVMTFDEPLYATTGVAGIAAQVIDNNLVGNYVNLINQGTGAVIPHTATISADYKTITITPTAAIAQAGVAATKVRYGFKTGADVGDYQGNRILGGSTQVLDAATVATNSATTFAETTIRDYKAPKVIALGYTPVGATTATATMRIQFDEDIAKGSGNLYIRELTSGNIVETIAASAITVVNNDVVLGDYITVPHAAFPMNTQFYVTIDAGFVTDISVSKNQYAGISDATSTIGKTWTFNTADINGPTVKTMTPAASATEVLLEQKLILVFDQPVKAGTSGNIVIYEEDGTPFDIIPFGSTKIDFNAQYAAGGGDTIVSISHIKFLDSSTYFVRIDKGTIEDKSGNDYIGIADRSWSFKTEDYTPATYTIVSPLDDATTVALMPTFELSFNRAIMAGTGKIQLWKRAGDVKLQEIAATAATIAANGMSATFTFPTKLPEATDLYIIISANAFVNASVSHVPFVGITEQWTWNFTTGTDATAPTMVSVSPTTTGLKPADVVLEITLSEDVQAGTGNIVIYNAADDQMVESIAIGSATIAGAKVTATPTALAEQMSYYVKVDAGAITDKAVTPNAYAGITDKTTWAFSTGDFTAPTMVSVEPTATTLTANHPELVLTVSELVKLTATGGSVTITKVGATTASVTIPLTAAMISADGKTITITYTSAAGGLDKNTDYFVTVPAGALEDNAGNDFAGVTDATAWTFKTGADFATGNNPVIGSLEYKVYPNPFVNELKVDNASELSRIIITSMTGQKVKEIVNPTSTIQTNELRSGVYFISLYVDDVVAKTERIVKR